MTSTDLFDHLPFILTTIVAVVVSLYLILEDENSNTSTNKVEEQCNLVQQLTAMMIVAMSWKCNNNACELDDGNQIGGSSDTMWSTTVSGQRMQSIKITLGHHLYSTIHCFDGYFKYHEMSTIY